MVERYIARLNLTHDEAVTFTPKPGIDIIWLEWEKPDVVVAEFVGSDLYPQPLLRKSAAEIRHEVLTTFRNRVITENLGTHPKSPRRALKIETLLDHPNVTANVPREIKMAAEAATEVHDVEMTKEQFDQVERPLTGGVRQQLEPREIRRRPKQQITERNADGRIVQRDTGGQEEVYVMSFGVIDIG